MRRALALGSLMLSACGLLSPAHAAAPGSAAPVPLLRPQLAAEPVMVAHRKLIVILGQRGPAPTPPSDSVAHAGPWTAANVRQALVGASPVVACIVAAETGHTYNPYLVSPTDDHGPAQLHRNGPQWREYLAGWGSDVHDPYRVIPYLAWALTHGEGPAWTTYRQCT